MAQRWSFSEQFKAILELDTLRGDKTVRQIAVKHQPHNYVSTWRRQTIEGMDDVFSGDKQAAVE